MGVSDETRRIVETGGSSMPADQEAEPSCGFSIMDVIEDDCRVRMLNLWAFLLVFVFFVFGLLRSAAPATDITGGVQIRIPAPRYMVQGQSTANRRLTARSTYVNGAPKVGAHIQPYVRSLAPSGPLRCAYPADTTDMANTLEGERLKDVCRFEVSGGGRTDETGVSKLDDFVVQGPSGTYEVGVQIAGEEFRSVRSSKIVARTEVSSMSVHKALDPSQLLTPPVETTPGQPFLEQPAVKLLDADGQPVSGAVVTAFSNPDPVWPPTGPQAAELPLYNRRGQRYAKLSCPRSEPSDENGIARFTCLGVESSTDSRVFIIFAVGAFVFLPWNDPLFDSMSLLTLAVDSYMPGTRLRTTVEVIDVLARPPTVAQEGDLLPSRLRLEDAFGRPVAGQFCQALVSSVYGNSLPMLFPRRVKGSRSKELLFATSQASDSGGIVVFPELQVSRHGNTRFKSPQISLSSSDLGITFACNGILSQEIVTTVQSRVAQVQIKRFISKEAFLSRVLQPESADESDSFIGVVRVLDARGQGVAGKTVYVDGGASFLTLEAEDGVEPTSESGFAVVRFRVATVKDTSSLVSGSTGFTVKFSVDGVESDLSEQLTVKTRESTSTSMNASQCHGLIATGATIINPANSSEFATLNLQVQPAVVLSGYWTSFQLQVSSGAADSPFTLGSQPAGRIGVEVLPAYSTDVHELCRRGQCRQFALHQPVLATTRSEPDVASGTLLQQLDQTPGLVNIMVKVNAPTGSQYVRFKLDIDVPPYDQECFSYPVLLDVRNPVVQLRVADLRGNEIGLMYSTEQPLDLELNFHLLAQTSALLNLMNKTHLGLDEWEDGALTMEWYEYPRTLRSAWPRNWTSLVRVTEVFGFRMSGENGHMRLRLEWLVPGIFGNFAVGFRSHGVRSNVFSFTLEEPYNLAVEVLQEPGFNNDGDMVACVYTSDNCWPTGKVLSVQPVVRVTSNGQPVTGVALFAELVPANVDAKFEGVARTDLVDVTGLAYSSLSGLDHDFQPAGFGTANWSSLVVMDGAGCMQWRFRTATVVVSGLHPPDPLCFISREEMHILRQPPRSMPLGIPLDEIASGASAGSNGGAMSLEVKFPHGVPYLVGQGTFGVRFVITHLNGRELSLAEAEAYTLRWLGNSVCFWVNSVELSGHCTPLVALPSGSVSTEVLKLTWVHVTELPATIRIMASDLSLARFAKQDIANPIPMPPSLPSTTTQNRTQVCLDAFETAYQDLVQQTTVDIKPELKPTSAELLVPPPAITQLGESFLVRLRIITASGAPARNGRVNVAIAGTSQMAAGAVSAEVLQTLANEGNTLDAFQKDGVAELQSKSVEAAVSSSGLASFTLMVMSGKSGTYELKFQVAEPGSTVILTTPPFLVMNPIKSITEPSGAGRRIWEVSSFTDPVRIPHQPQFHVLIPDGRSLAQLQDDAVFVSLTATLRGASRKLVDKRRQMLETRQRDAENRQRAAAESAASRSFVQAQKSSNVVEQRLGRLSPDFRAQCRRTAIGPLEESGSQPEVRPPSTAEVVEEDPGVLHRSAAVSNFVRSFTGGGSTMVTTSEMTAMLSVSVPFSELELVSAEVDEDGAFRGVYAVTRDITFSFEEGAEYTWSMSLAGVQNEEGAFTVFRAEQVQPTAWETLLFWIAAACAAIVCVFSLMANTRSWNWSFLLFTAALTIGCIVLAPFLKGPDRALEGRWVILAVANFSLVLICLVWALCCEKNDLSMPFGLRRQLYFSQYVRKQFVEAVRGSKSKPHPENLSFYQQFQDMVQNFNADTAFYFPTQLLIGLFLSFFAFAYMLYLAIRLAISIQRTILSMSDMVTNMSLNFMSTMDANFFSAAGGAELPDSALSFVLTQLDLVNDWLKSLVLAVEVGLTLGVVCASVLTIAAFFITLFDFRQRVLKARRGVRTWLPEEVCLYENTSFMGSLVATTVVGFCGIVVIVTIIVTFLAWDVTRNLIWAMRFYVLVFFLLWLLDVFKQRCINKLFYEGPVWIRHRAALSCYMFFYTWLSFLAGIARAAARLGMCIVGVLTSLPLTVYAATPSFKANTILGDPAYRLYLSCVLVHHAHCNPVVWEASQRLLRLQQEKRRRIEEGASRVALQDAARRKSRNLVLLLLLKHPWLAKYRKAHLLAQREQQKLATVQVQVHRKPTPAEKAVLQRIARRKKEVVAAESEVAALIEELRDLRKVSPERQAPPAEDAPWPPEPAPQFPVVQTRDAARSSEQPQSPKTRIGADEPPFSEQPQALQQSQPTPSTEADGWGQDSGNASAWMRGMPVPPPTPQPKADDGSPRSKAVMQQPGGQSAALEAVLNGLRSRTAIATCPPLPSDQ